MSLAVLASTESRVTATYRDGLEVLYGAEAALERVLPDLAAEPDFTLCSPAFGQLRLSLMVRQGCGNSRTGAFIEYAHGSRSDINDEARALGTEQSTMAAMVRLRSPSRSLACLRGRLGGGRSLRD